MSELIYRKVDPKQRKPEEPGRYFDYSSETGADVYLYTNFSSGFEKYDFWLEEIPKLII